MPTEEIQARNELVMSAMSFAAHKARQFCGLHDIDDARQEAALALIEAANRYKPEHGTKYISYAYRWVHYGIQRAAAKQDYFGRSPETMRLLRLVKSEAKRLQKEDGEEPSDEKLAEVVRQKHRREAYLTLERVRKNRYAPLRGEMPRSCEIPALDETRDVLLEDAIWECLELIPERQAFCIVKHYGLDGGQAQEPEEIAKILGICKRYVQMELSQGRRALKKHLGERKITVWNLTS
jgi:RNA polymerase sigma factor (sigma-70 family)